MKTAILSMMMAWAFLGATVSSALAAGGVDWEGQRIVVTGVGIAPPSAVNGTQAKLLARRAAVVDGYRQLAELINGVQVDAESTVENLVMLSDVVRTRVSACVQGARILDEKIAQDGSCHVRMEVPMYGASTSLASAVLEKPAERQPFPLPAVETYGAGEAASPYPSLRVEVNVNPPAAQGSARDAGRRYAASNDFRSYASDSFYARYPGYGRYPDDPSYPGYSGYPDYSGYPGRQPSWEPSYPAAQAPPAESKPVKEEKKKEKEKEKEKKQQTISGDYTSLVVDCTGLGLCPAMSPVIKNEKDEAIYGASNLDYDLVATRGMAAYWRDLDVSAVSRAGEKPLVVKCVSLSGNSVNPVLTVDDANRVLLENEQSHFLDQLNVILVR